MAHTIKDKEKRKIVSGILKNVKMHDAQSIIDICTHIVSRESDNIPQTYADCMKELAKLKIITTELAEKLSQMVKTRNLVVHQYEIVNNELVVTALKEILDDLELYKEAIFQWLDREK